MFRLWLKSCVFFFFYVRNKEEEKSGLCLYYRLDHPSKLHLGSVLFESEEEEEFFHSPLPAPWSVGFASLAFA